MSSVEFQAALAAVKNKVEPLAAAEDAYATAARDLAAAVTELATLMDSLPETSGEGAARMHNHAAAKMLRQGAEQMIARADGLAQHSNHGAVLVQMVSAIIGEPRG